MRISQKNSNSFAQLISTIAEKADNIEILNEALDSLSIEELERTKAYFAGTGTRTSFYQLRSIVMGSFIAGMMIFLLNMFQGYFFVAVISVTFLAVCVSHLFIIALTLPIMLNVRLAYARGKYDRIVSLIDIILTERYTEIRRK
ncbi:hypothetical protein [Listeria booriae]|uniref:Uncharacterized protein n=1 Tax=Listeria booriae TaxID=1552123 RepID=A0A842AAU5_9LIST|nr:hypothetical protein [Listeria booriae]MBC1401683.1 hypothetical protein [Listeria booriae]MBC1615069.1 hypothetical protein [Listeria booriae]MBC2318819.1 hypothetical protein [Listeria booriae]